jgi:hypothetical protein
MVDASCASGPQVTIAPQVMLIAAAVFVRARSDAANDRCTQIDP